MASLVPMQRVAVINVVGLTAGLIGPQTPRIRQFARSGSLTTLRPAFPAVTCTAQTNYLTGVTPAAHGIVGNGWYDRSLAEVHFWKQSERLVQAPALWEELRRTDPSFTCAKLFWWYNMASSADYSITPRPMYPADGRKIFDIYSWPYSIRSEIKRDLGEFPFATFWGPAAGVDTSRGPADAASRWIEASARWIEERYRPTLSLVYLPHLDYGFQRYGPRQDAPELSQIDAIVGDLIDFFSTRSVAVLILSEYGIVPVTRPIHLNRLFRERGWISIKEELGLELADLGASRVFAVADHQVAHIYLNDPSLYQPVRRLMESTEGVDQVLDEPAKHKLGINHARAGDLIAVARDDAWFSYYYWLDDRRAPDFARTVDIHRKPGYDPVELFFGAEQPLLGLQIFWRLMRKKLGFRYLMDVVSLDPSLVRGSHGAVPRRPDDQPVLIAGVSSDSAQKDLESTDVHLVIRRVLKDARA